MGFWLGLYLSPATSRSCLVRIRGSSNGRIRNRARLRVKGARNRSRARVRVR